MVWRTLWITVSTCFLLGTTFTHWVVDHNVMWANPTTPKALDRAITYYSLLASAPSGMGWAYIVLGVSAVLSAATRLSKGMRGGESEVLFDGGSVVLLAGVACVQVYSVFPSILTIAHEPSKATLESHHLFPVWAESVHDLASDNIMCAVMLTGVILLQAGRYYSKRSASKEHAAFVAEQAKSGTHVEQDLSSLSRRSATPFRELTEDEAMELSGVRKI